MTANEKRLAVRNKYREILGRNVYSQPRRNYCFKKYSNGKYYSDCSSSVSYSYKEAGFSFGILNTVGMYNSKKFTDIPVTIKKGIIQNPEILRIGDMLLFAGTDKSRKSAGYVGHVEMVGEINGSTITLYGHGGGNPKKVEMNSKCKSRYNSKTSTPLGNKGLIKVKRFIQDDNQEGDDSNMATTAKQVTITGSTVNIRSGPGTDYESVGTVRKGEKLPLADAGNWYPVIYNGSVRWVSNNMSKEEG